MNTVSILFGLCLLLGAVGCQTSDKALIKEGHTESYLQGYHDGRHSGLREAGNHFEHYVQDRSRFESDSEYNAGWQAGETVSTMAVFTALSSFHDYLLVTFSM